MLITLACVGASNLIKYATQFTDDVFNALLSVNFIFEVRFCLFYSFSLGLRSRIGSRSEYRLGCVRDYLTSGSRSGSKFGSIIVLFLVESFARYLLSR